MGAICGVSKLRCIEATGYGRASGKLNSLWERSRKIPQIATRRYGVQWESWGMPKPLRRIPGVESPFVLRAELLTLVPHSMSTIDRLEAEGQFPSRIRLDPTNRVAWVRREV